MNTAGHVPGPPQCAGGGGGAGSGCVRQRVLTRPKTWWQPVRRPATVSSVGDKEGLSEMAFVMETGGQVLGTASASLGGGPSQRGGGRRGNCILKTQGHSLPRAPPHPEPGGTCHWELRRHPRAEAQRGRGTCLRPHSQARPAASWGVGRGPSHQSEGKTRSGRRSGNVILKPQPPRGPGRQCQRVAGAGWAPQASWAAPDGSTARSDGFPKESQKPRFYMK